MVDETNVAETAKNEAEAQVTDKTETVEELKARLDEAERRAKNKADEAARHFKKLEKFEQEEARRKEAEMSEIERANKRAQELEAKVKQLEFSKLQHEIAAKVGLQSVFADRIRGETPEEMEADAKMLLDALPKPKAAPNIGATNPGDKASIEETYAQKMERLMGGNPDIWGGGGINWGPPTAPQQQETK